jgi:hypothetical protein
MEFKLEFVVPHMYGIFIDAWDMFSHYDEVPLYFMKNLCDYFVLHINPNYASNGFAFYGLGTGHSYD